MMTTMATPDQRRSALFQDALLFCGAFTCGAILFSIVNAIVEAVKDSTAGRQGYWEIGLSDGLILSGLGFTWEKRVQNAKSAAQYVHNLR